MGRNLMAGLALLTVISVLYILMGFTTEVWEEEEFGARADDTHWRLSMATGTSALVFLSAALLVGPIRQLRDKPTPAHIPWRRSLGVSASVAVLIHVSFGITIHADGWRVWVPFTHVWRSSGSLFVLGAAFWIGLLAALLMSVLAIISNSRALRGFGVRRWKNVQRLTYLVYPLVFVHILGVQRQEQRVLGHALLPLLLMGLVFSIQLFGFISTRRAVAARHPSKT